MNEEERLVKSLFFSFSHFVGPVFAFGENGKDSSRESEPMLKKIASAALRLQLAVCFVRPAVRTVQSEM